MQSEKQLDQAMVGLTESEQLEFLKVQLKFRKKKLLEQKASNVKLFNFSIQEEDAQGNKKRRQLEPHELASNVKQLIAEGQLTENPEQPIGTTSLVNMQVRHRQRRD